VRRPFWQWFHRKFEVLAPDGQTVAFVLHPILKLREEFTIYADRAQTEPLLHVKVRKLMTLNHCYDVFASQGGARLGSLRKRGVRSLVRDMWDVLDEHEAPVGVLMEEGWSFVRRMMPLLLAKYRLEIGGDPVARIRQRFRCFVKEFDLELTSSDRIEPRFAIACCLLALMAESRREDRN
jgi:uncharacterized protein YxjI